MPKYQPTFRWHIEPRVLWLDHFTLRREHLSELRDVQVLKCWAVKLEDPELLRDLPKLWWLDWRGGSDNALAWIGDLSTLKYVQIWHAYRLESVDFLARLPTLQAFMLHALTRVSRLPSFASSARLHTVELSTLKSLADISGLVQAPNLENLALFGRLALHPEELRVFSDHPNLKRFAWVDLRLAAQAVVKREEFPSMHCEMWPFRDLSEGEQETLHAMRDLVKDGSDVLRLTQLENCTDGSPKDCTSFGQGSP